MEDYLQKLGQNVTLQVQADMLGYHVVRPIPH